MVKCLIFYVCKTFMRRFDPGPRLQFPNNLRVDGIRARQEPLWTFVGHFALGRRGPGTMVCFQQKEFKRN
jgi:hypothetical protein